MGTTAPSQEKERPAVRDILFAELSRRTGKASAEVLEKGRKVLAELGHFGITRSLSSVLVERKLVDRKVEKEVMREVAAIAVTCAGCRGPVLLEDLGAEAHLRCPRCQGLLSVELSDGPPEAAIDGAPQGRIED